MNVLSLFSGGGLGDYGLTLAGMEIVGQVEWDKYCQKILKLRWPEVPKWGDVRNVRGEEVVSRCGTIDLISGGFPCQPFSCAGKQKGKDDERNMWPEMHRIISEVKPAWVLAENVRGIVKPYLDTVLSDLEGLGYACLPLLIPACALGAPHKRERLWILGNAKLHGSSSSGIEGAMHEPQKPSESIPCGESSRTSCLSGDVAHAKCNGLQRIWENWEVKRPSGLCGGTRRDEKENLCNSTSEGLQNRPAETLGESRSIQELERPNWWTTEPDVGRVAHGVANRVDRLKLLGNGQVVQIVEWLGSQIIKADKEMR